MLIPGIFTVVLGSFGPPDGQSDTPTIIGSGSGETLSPDWSISNLELKADSDKKKKKKYFHVAAAKVQIPSRDPKLTSFSTGTVHLGETLYLRVWLRSTTQSDSNHPVIFRLYGRGSEQKMLGEKKVAPAATWKEFKFAFSTSDYYLPGDLALEILDPTSTEFDFSDLRVLNMGEAVASSLTQTDLNPTRKTKGKAKVTED